MTGPIEALGVPASEFNEQFIQQMRTRMAVSYHKYGPMAEADRVDKLASLQVRLERYRETGNTEWLVDVANFALMEYTHPAHREAHFRATDSDESPGRVVPNRVTGALMQSARHNIDTE